MQDSTSQGFARRWMEGALLFFVIITCVRVWVGPIELTPQADAQIPNAGDQRNEILAVAQKTNHLLDQIIDRLDNGTLNVRVMGADNNGDEARPKRSKPARR